MRTMIVADERRRPLVYRWQLSLAAAFALFACANATTDLGGGAGSAAGTYILTTVNGQPLPATYQVSAGVTAKIISGMFTLNGADNGYTYSSNWEETAAGQTSSHSENCAGTWTRNGNSFFITEVRTVNCGGTYTAVWDAGDRLTVSFSTSLVMGFAR